MPSFVRAVLMTSLLSVSAGLARIVQKSLRWYALHELQASVTGECRPISRVGRMQARGLKNV